MKRILHISKYYYPFSGGTEQIARDCVLALKDTYEQKVIAFNDRENDETSMIDGVEVIKCGCFIIISAQSLSLSYAKWLRKIMHDFNPDIIVFHYPNPFVAAILLKELKNSSAKFIVYWHLDIIRQRLLRIFFRSQNRQLLNRADKIIATSPNYIEGSEWLREVKQKCVVIPNCINVERMKITQEIEQRASEIRKEHADKIICVAVGRHTRYKGFLYLIQASKLLDDNFRFFITGKGELTKKLQKRAAGDSKIVFTGLIEDVELKALVLASDIFCFPSITKNEAFGLALAEGMYYEKPAVTFTIQGSGVNYVCLHGENCIEVENGNVRKYAYALRKLAQDKELRIAYGKAGKKRVEDNFLSTQFCEHISRLIVEIGGSENNLLRTNIISKG